MPNIIYLNGQFVNHTNALISVNDRGYQFADAAYEVVLFINSVGIDMDEHLNRLDRTLQALQINSPMSRQALIINMQTLMHKNKISTGMIYIQISRGVSVRNHPFPKGNISPTCVMIAKPINYDKLKHQSNKTLSLTLLADERWKRCDLKTVGLLPNILAMQKAIDLGFDDALLYNQQGITEGTSWNFWIINPDNSLQTHPLDQEILWGITRNTIFKIAQQHSIKIIEKPILLNELNQANAAFVTSATKIIMAVNTIDNIKFNIQHPTINMLRQAYFDYFNFYNED
jgi:D-alanine transaminase